MADTDGLREAARPGARVVVVGGGYIGLEVAATCRELGVDVTVLEMADRVMNRVVCEPVSRYYEAEHRNTAWNTCSARACRISSGMPGARSRACAAPTVANTPPTSPWSASA